MATTAKGKLFYADAEKGYIIKVAIDTLAISMSRTDFKVSKKGLFHRGADGNKHILFDIEFPRNSFAVYECRKEFEFSVNLKHFQKMVRNVKKKDSIILFIEKGKKDKLGIVIKPSGATSGRNTRLETVYIAITDAEPELEDDLPEKHIDANGNEVDVYGYPMIIEASDFQKLKKMASVGKIVSVEMQQNNYISFYSDFGQLYSSRLEFGEIVDDPEMEEESEEESEEEKESDDDEIKGWYEAEFHMSIFNLLLKLPGLCTHMQFYSPKVERYPLKISMKAGTLGKVTTYIKDARQIAIEDAQRRQLRETEEGISTSSSRKK